MFGGAGVSGGDRIEVREKPFFAPSRAHAMAAIYADMLQS